MIRYDVQNQVVVMDLVDLEHCGFNHDAYRGELFLSGIDETPETTFPLAIIVNVAGGHIVTPDTRAATIEKMTSARARFEKLIARLEIRGEEHG